MKRKLTEMMIGSTHEQLHAPVEDLGAVCYVEGDKDVHVREMVHADSVCLKREKFTQKKERLHKVL